MLPKSSLVEVSTGLLSGAVGQIAEIIEIDEDTSTYMVAFTRSTLNQSPKLSLDIKDTALGEILPYSIDDLIVITPI